MKRSLLDRKVFLSLALGPAIIALGVNAYSQKNNDSTAETNALKGAFMEPVAQNIRGWTIYVDPLLLPGGAENKNGAKALSMLENHLERIEILVPAAPLAELKKIGIQIEHAHPELDNMQYHPGKEWLIGKKYDPRLVKRVHLPVAASLYSRSQMLKHPAVILHELCHAYHDQVLSFEHPGIIDAYDNAIKAGFLEEVMTHNGRITKAYAATNHKEYFAEITEAFLYRNDFYPFVNGELKKTDPVGYALLEEIWGKTE